MVGDEMISRRVILYVTLATLAGLAVGRLALVSAALQDSRVNQQATNQTPLGQHNVTALVTNAPPADGISSQVASGSINPLWTVPLASFAAIRDRPIFSPSRRPAVNANPPSVQPGPLPIADQRPPFALIGVVAGETDGIGIFLDQATKKIVRLKTQESHAGWTLNLVKGREATLQRGGEIAVLEIPNP